MRSRREEAEWAFGKKGGRAEECDRDRKDPEIANELEAAENEKEKVDATFAIEEVRYGVRR
jgi:hypothetical protein